MCQEDALVSQSRLMEILAARVGTALSRSGRSWHVYGPSLHIVIIIILTLRYPPRHEGFRVPGLWFRV